MEKVQLTNGGININIWYQCCKSLRINGISQTHHNPLPLFLSGLGVGFGLKLGLKTTKPQGRIYQSRGLRVASKVAGKSVTTRSVEGEL